MGHAGTGSYNILMRSLPGKLQKEKGQFGHVKA